MNDLMGLILGLAIAAVIYVLDRFLPKWFGAVLAIAFLVFVIYLMITRGKGQTMSVIVVLLVGEAVLNGIWLYALRDRKNKERREMESMKAQDLAHNNE